MNFFHARDIMLTSKDVLYLEDLLTQTCALCVRIQHETTLLNDQAVSDCFTQVYDRLSDHYQTMLTILEKECSHAEE